MKKKCTNPACRRVFSTAGGRTECPHCGKEYSRMPAMQQPARKGRNVPREANSGCVEIRRQSGVQHVWIGPAKRGSSARVDRFACTCVLKLPRLTERELKLKRLKALRGDDRFLGLTDAKAAIEAMLAAPAVLHTDAVTARNVLDSGLFPASGAKRATKQKPAKRQCPNVVCRRMFRPGRGRMVCPHCGAEVCREAAEDLNNGQAGFIGLEASVAGDVTFAWRRDLGWPDFAQKGCRVLLNRLPEGHAAALMHWALEGDEKNWRLHNLFGLYRQNGVWDAGEVSSEYRPMYNVIRRLGRGPVLLRTDLDTARSIVASGLFPIRRVTRSR